MTQWLVFSFSLKDVSDLIKQTNIYKSAIAREGYCVIVGGVKGALLSSNAWDNLILKNQNNNHYYTKKYTYNYIFTTYFYTGKKNK